MWGVACSALGQHSLINQSLSLHRTCTPKASAAGIPIRPRETVALALWLLPMLVPAPGVSAGRRPYPLEGQRHCDPTSSVNRGAVAPRVGSEGWWESTQPATARVPPAQRQRNHGVRLL